MKRLLYSLITLMLCGNLAAQTCPSENITFERQGQIDSFAINYPGCTQIPVGITINDTSPDVINNLDGLGQIEQINTFLSIKYNSSLTNLSGLENLNSLGSGLYIIGNAELTDISALSGITSIGNHLDIYNNSKLPNLNGLNNVTTIGGDLYFSNNPMLNSIASLINVTHVDEAIIIKDCPTLTSLQGLNNILASGECLIVDNMDGLTDLSGLESLGSLGTYLRIWDNDNLTSFNGLSSLAIIGEYASVLNNPVLPNFSGLESLTTINETFYCENNPALVNMNGLNNLSYVGDVFTIESNPSLVNLSGLESLTAIGNGLNINYNNSLVNLEGLNNLETIEAAYDGLAIRRNPMLTDISALSKLTSAAYITIIYDNDALTSLDGLQNINTPRMIIAQNQNLSMCSVTGVCDYFYAASPSNYTVDANAPNCNTAEEILINCGGLPNLDCPPESLNLTTQQQVNEFAITYPTCTHINGELYIHGSNITDLTPLSGIVSVAAGLHIFDNNNLTNLAGLENITTAGDLLHIKNNSSLTDLEGLEGLTTVGGDAWIDSNPNLNSLTGLENLTSIGGELRVRFNDALLSFDGLSGLTAIAGNLTIVDNNLLENLNGLENLDHTTITNLRIRDNDVLSICNTTSVCDYISTGGSRSIGNNAAGCNSASEIESTCTDISEPCEGGGSPASIPLSHVFDEDLFIDGVGFSNNSNIAFAATSANAVLSDISLELYFKLSGSSCENEIAIQITDPSGNTQPLTAYTTCNGGNSLYYVNLDVPSVNTTVGAADWLIEFDDTNDQNSGYEYSVRFVRLSYVSTIQGSGSTTIVGEVSEHADSDLFIDGVGFANNGNYTFTDPGTPGDAVLSDISLELYFRLNGNSCENEIALQITDPAGNTQPLTAYTTCDGGNGLFYVNLDVPNGSTTGSTADWLVEFDDTNDQNSGYEYSVRFGRLTYTTTYTQGGGDGTPVTVNGQVSEHADSDLFIDGVGFANNGNYTFTDPGTPADAVLSNISLELYFRLNGNSCENEIAIQITDPAGNTQALTAYTTCNGGNGLFYVDLAVPSGSTTGSVADWTVEFDDTNDQNTDYEYSVRFGRLTYQTAYNVCDEMMMKEQNNESQQANTPTSQQPVNSSTRQLNNPSLKLYPVPASHLLNVEYFSENANSTNIEILSNEGKILIQKDEFLQEGINTIQLDIAELPAGHYHIRMYNASDMQMQSFVKIAP